MRKYTKHDLEDLADEMEELEEKATRKRKKTPRSNDDEYWTPDRRRSSKKHREIDESDSDKERPIE